MHNNYTTLRPPSLCAVYRRLRFALLMPSSIPKCLNAAKTETASPPPCFCAPFLRASWYKNTPSSETIYARNCVNCERKRVQVMQQRGGMVGGSTLATKRNASYAQAYVYNATHGPLDITNDTLGFWNSFGRSTNTNETISLILYRHCVVSYYAHAPARPLRLEPAS